MNANLALTPQSLPMLKIHELKELIQQVQDHNQEALNQLCRHFEPFIKKLAARYANCLNLACDIENMAWIIFIEFVQSCSLDRISTILKAIIINVKSKLLTELHSRKCNDPHLVYTEDYLIALEATYNEEPGIIASLDMNKALQCLTPKQKNFIREYLSCNGSYEFLAKKFKTTVNGVKQRRKYIVSKIRKISK